MIYASVPELFSGVGGNSVFVLVVQLDLEEFLDALGRPHLDSIPRHSFADVNADFAADALIKADLHVWNNDVDTVGSIAWREFNAVDRTETDTGLAAGAIVRYDDGNFLRLLFFPRNFRGSFGNDRGWIGFFRVRSVCQF